MNDLELKSILANRLELVQERIAQSCTRATRKTDEITLVAVTKTVSCRVVRVMHELGISHFGENRPQELWKKAADLPAAQWHLIGHLQRNKIDKTIPLIHLMHSVDSERLLFALHEYGLKHHTPLPVLIEVNCSREEAKGGFSIPTIQELADQFKTFNGIRIEGLMTMAAYHDDPQHSRSTFVELRSLRDQFRTQTGLALPHLSMGMSNDFEVAIEEGATFVRIGTTLFEGLEDE